MALMVLGLSLGQVRHEDSDWTKFLLADGREIGIAPTTKGNSKEFFTRRKAELSPFHEQR